MLCLNHWVACPAQHLKVVLFMGASLIQGKDVMNG